MQQDKLYKKRWMILGIFNRIVASIPTDSRAFFIPAIYQTPSQLLKIVDHVFRHIDNDAH